MALAFQNSGLGTNSFSTGLKSQLVQTPNRGFAPPPKKSKAAKTEAKEEQPPAAAKKEETTQASGD